MSHRSVGRIQQVWRGWIRPLVMVVVVCCSFRSAVADWNDVPTGSMKPTILEGDRIFVNKLAYDLRIPFTDWRLVEWGRPKRGDIVVCRSPADGKRLVKRVIAVEGDRVEMRNNRLCINGRPVEISQAGERSDGPTYRVAEEIFDGRAHLIMSTPALPAQRSFAARTVPPGHCFLMGDNRDNSLDSRAFGFVTHAEIVGRTRRLVFSLDRDRCYLPRWDRILHRLD